jgi:hypothetical protein
MDMFEPQPKPDSSQLEVDLILNQHERTFLLDAQTAFSFWELAARRLRPVRTPYGRPLQYIRTTYFDTEDFAYYRGRSGPTVKRLRAREYANAPDPHTVPELTGECVLELKQSGAGRRSKSRVKMAPAEVPGYLARYAANRHDGALLPCLTTWYQRAALTDADDRLRVTLDSRIRFCAPVLPGTPCTGVEPEDVLACGPQFVLELKMWDEPPAWLANTMQVLQEAVGFSKFNAGMRAAEECGLLDSPSEIGVEVSGPAPAESLGA